MRVGDLLRGTGGAAESPAAAFARRKEAWAVRIHAGVQDASLWADIPDQVAAGVAEGRIKEEEVDGLLRALDRQRRAGKLRSAAAYFNIAAIKLLKRHGVYRQPKPKRGQA